MNNAGYTHFHAFDLNNPKAESNQLVIEHETLMASGPM